MPQLFGVDQLDLMSLSSLWVEAGFLENVEAHEKALSSAGFNQGELPANVNKEGFHPRGDVWGQHLRSDSTHHTWAVARVVNPMMDPNARRTDVGGEKPRYSVEIHSVPKVQGSARARGSITPIWEGNDITEFLEGRRTDGGMTWPDVQRAMQQGSRR